jgi:hypothetical protein
LENEIGISLCGFEVVRDGIPEDDFWPSWLKSTHWDVGKNR